MYILFGGSARGAEKDKKGFILDQKFCLKFLQLLYVLFDLGF